MLLGKLFQSKWLALWKALLPKDLHLVFRTANRSLKLIKWIDPFDTNILSCIINNGVATPLLCVERGVRRGRGGPISPFYLSLVLPSNRMKVIIRKGIHVNSSLLQMIWHVSFTTKKICCHTLPHCIHMYDECSSLKLNKDRKEAYWFNGYTVLIAMQKPSI